jgi:hypothetical protein
MRNVLAIIKHIKDTGVLRPLSPTTKSTIKESLEFLISLHANNETESN